jgi:hypothetical protein
VCHLRQFKLPFNHAPESRFEFYLNYRDSFCIHLTMKKLHSTLFNHRNRRREREGIPVTFRVTQLTPPLYVYMLQIRHMYDAMLCHPTIIYHHSNTFHFYFTHQSGLKHSRTCTHTHTTTTNEPNRQISLRNIDEC